MSDLMPIMGSKYLQNMPMAMLNEKQANRNQLMHRLEGPPLLMSGEKADFVIDQASAKYTDSEIEEEKKKQQAKIDASIVTLGLGALSLKGNKS
jgi:hypothetical protein